MPIASRTIDNLPARNATYSVASEHLTTDKKTKPANLSHVTCQMSHVAALRQGFSLVEVLILLVILFAMVLILLTGATTLRKSYSTNLSGIGAKIASCEIERLRGLTFGDPGMANVTNQTITAPCDADFSKLPAGTAKRTVADYGGDPLIKQITIDVSWTGNSVQLVTLKSKYGI